MYRFILNIRYLPPAVLLAMESKFSFFLQVCLLSWVRAWHWKDSSPHLLISRFPYCQNMFISVHRKKSNKFVTTGGNNNNPHNDLGNAIMPLLHQSKPKIKEFPNYICAPPPAFTPKRKLQAFSILLK